MFENHESRQLSLLIDQYLIGAINAWDFCNQFHDNYGVSLDLSTLTQDERKIFSALSTVAGRFSPYEEDHLGVPGFFYTEKELTQKVIETAKLLSKTRWRLSDVDIPKHGDRLSKLFKDNTLEGSWNSVKVGWDLKYLDTDDIAAFALHFLEQNQHVINAHISDLILQEPNLNIDLILKKLFLSLTLEFPEKNSPLWNKEWRKWRYCVLMDLVKHVQNKEELLMKAEGVYVEFGRPEDMKPFIYYMPADDTISTGDREDTREHLLEKLRFFLEEEKMRIKADCDFLPPTEHES
jgi:hypothetical protein